MNIKQHNVKAISLCDFINNPTVYFHAYQWVNKEGIIVEFSSNKKDFFISIPDLMFDDILSFSLSDDLFIDYNKRFEGRCLKDFRLFINSSNTINLRIQNQFGEECIEFKDLIEFDAFVSIIKHFNNNEE